MSYNINVQLKNIPRQKTAIYQKRLRISVNEIFHDYL